MDKQTEIEAAAFRRLLVHLDDVDKILLHQKILFYLKKIFSTAG